MFSPLIIGIAGGSGSGKTTIASGLCRLTEHYGSVVISQDDYYFGLPEGTDVSRYNFDDPSALDLERLASDLLELKAGKTVNLPVYDFTCHRRSDAVQSVAPVPLIFVEGLFVFATPALRAVFDICFFVDVPEHERLRRRILRDVRERGRCESDIREQWAWQVEPMYAKHTLPTRACAHFVLELPHPNDHAYCEQVVAMWSIIEQRLTRSAGTGEKITEMPILKKINTEDGLNKIEQE
jgi:uridine kinase